MKTIRCFLVWWNKVCLGFWGMMEDPSGGKRALSQSRSLVQSTTQPLMEQGWAKITWVLTLMLWNQSSVDKSTHMMEGRVIFRQGQLNKAPKNLRLLRPQREPQIRAPPTPFALRSSRNPPVALGAKGKAARCRSQRDCGSAGVLVGDACPPALPLGNQATADPQ